MSNLVRRITRNIFKRMGYERQYKVDEETGEETPLPYPILLPAAPGRGTPKREGPPRGSRRGKHRDGFKADRRIKKEK